MPSDLDIRPALNALVNLGGTGGGSGGGDASSANQLIANTSLSDILTELRNDVAFTETVWYNKNNTALFYIRVATINQQTGVKVISFQNIDGSPAAPSIIDLVQVNASTDFEIITFQYKTIANGVGYTNGNTLQELRTVNTLTNTTSATIWLNKSLNTVIAGTPVFSDLVIDVGGASFSEQQAQTTRLTNIDNKLTSNANGLRVDGSAVIQPVSAATLPLPTGASTSALQTTGNSNLSSIDTKVTGLALETTQSLIRTRTDNLDVLLSTRLKPSDILTGVTSLGSITNTVVVRADTLANQVNAFRTDGSGVTQPISAVTLPLATGAATSALQTTGNTSLSSIDAKLTSPLAITGTVALSGTQTVSVNNFPATQAVSVATLPLATGAATSANQTTGNTSLNSIDLKTPSLGQALSNASFPVVLPATQITTLTPPAAITGFNLETTQAVINTKIPTGLTVTAGRLQVELPVGGAGLTNTEIRATPLPVSLSSTTISNFPVTQAVTLASSPLATGASTDTLQTTGNTSLNSIDLKTPTLGQTSMANSTPVVIASNQSTLGVRPVTQSATGSLSAIDNALTIALNGEANTTFQISGTWVGTVVFEASNDNFGTFSTINALRAGDATITQTITESANNDIYRCTTAGFGAVRARCLSYTSGTIIVNANTSFSTSGVFLNFPLPTGTNSIGSVKLTGKTTDLYPIAVPTNDSVIQEVSIDVDGNLATRSTVLTDEGTFRANFANTSLRVSIGTCTFTNGSDMVTGTNFAQYDIKVGDYVNIDVQAESTLAQIKSITLNRITLVNNYTGATTTGLASRQLLTTFIGTGAAITVAAGAATIASGITANATTVIGRFVDVAPLVLRAGVAVSQRIANQAINIGFNDSGIPIKWFARFSLDGTVNTTVKCQSGRNPTVAPTGNEIQETIVAIPNGLTTAVNLEYRVELLTEAINFFINNILVASHTRVIPSQYDAMSCGIAVLNGVTPASNTNIVLDYITCKNHNKLEIGVMSSAESIVATQPGLSNSTFNFSQVGVIPINTDLIVIDCNNLKELMVDLASIGVSGIISPQWSNDASFSTAFIGQSTNNAGGVTGTFNGISLFSIPVYARYCRFRLTTATTSGTTTLRVAGSQSLSKTVVVGNAVSVTGTLTGVTTVTTVGTLTTLANGQTAHSSPSTGSPVRTAARVTAVTPATQDVTLVAGDASDAQNSTAGQLIVKQFATAEIDWQFACSLPVANTTDLVVRAASGTVGIRNYITGFQILNTSTTVTTEIVIKDGATVVWRGFAPINVPITVILSTPLRGTGNTAVNFQCITTGAAVYISAQGYTSF